MSSGTSSCSTPRATSSASLEAMIRAHSATGSVSSVCSSRNTSSGRRPGNGQGLMSPRRTRPALDRMPWERDGTKARLSSVVSRLPATHSHRSCRASLVPTTII